MISTCTEEAATSDRVAVAQSYDLGALGYSNEELFLDGTASSHAPAGGEARYRTRAVAAVTPW